MNGKYEVKEIDFFNEIQRLEKEIQSLKEKNKNLDSLLKKIVRGNFIEFVFIISSTFLLSIYILR